ncbi:spore coat associated protein CotJA [Kroppenstedtia pulmonis]|uniref:Spore coat associated protein CotJA n=1 Tax=Kroppenstedtia pulmonis TaxID=1380685 RepID=A0A7D4BGJ9_9BACL|nr:spore coat associated protein CotJA [Kroppenstedtia pulmonis]QKG85132.1 spore coat associated protein CotJA [Kroppenstedtia pulmonis]
MRQPNPYTHQVRYWYPYVSPFDPCPPIRVKHYVVPPNQYLGFQPRHLPQFSPMEALRYGTLWPILYSPYEKTTNKGCRP